MKGNVDSAFILLILAKVWDVDNSVVIHRGGSIPSEKLTLVEEINCSFTLPNFRIFRILRAPGTVYTEHVPHLTDSICSTVFNGWAESSFVWTAM